MIAEEELEMKESGYGKEVEIRNLISEFLSDTVCDDEELEEASIRAHAKRYSVALVDEMIKALQYRRRGT